MLAGAISLLDETSFPLRGRAVLHQGLHLSGTSTAYHTSHVESNIWHTLAGSISSLDDISFSPMGQGVSHQGSDLSSLPNGLPLDAESGRSSEVCFRDQSLCPELQYVSLTVYEYDQRL